MPSQCLPTIQREILSLTPFVSFFSSPLAAHLFLSNTPSQSLLVLPYSHPAPLWYPSHPNIPISLRNPNRFPLSLSSDLQLIGPHDVYLRSLSMPESAAAARRPYNCLWNRLWGCWRWLSWIIMSFGRSSSMAFPRTQRISYGPM